MKNKKIIITTSIILIILLGAGFFVLKNHKVSYNKKNIGQNNNGQSTTPLQSKLTPNQSSSSSSPNSSSSTTNSTPNTSTQPNEILIAPTGSFVSNHNPVLSNPKLDTEQSTCNTSPGATCNIVFTSGSSTISLGSKVANSSGAVNWTWTLQNVGLTQGSWKITAVANLNQQTKSTSDQLMLNITQ